MIVSRSVNFLSAGALHLDGFFQHFTDYKKTVNHDFQF